MLKVPLRKELSRTIWPELIYERNFPVCAYGMSCVNLWKILLSKSRVSR